MFVLDDDDLAMLASAGVNILSVETTSLGGELGYRVGFEYYWLYNNTRVWSKGVVDLEATAPVADLLKLVEGARKRLGV